MTQGREPIAEIDILWITAGLRCGGETIAMTASMQPSIENIVRGGLPRIPTVHLHNPVLSYENGEEFLKPFREAAAGEGSPFILVVEGSIPNENNKEGGYWRRWARTDGPANHDFHGGHSDGMRSGMSSAAGQLYGDAAYLLHQTAGRAPMIPLDDTLCPTWLFGQTLHEGCDRGGYYEQGELGCWGPVVQCNVGKRGWMAGIGGCPNVGGICIGYTMPGLPDKFMPFMDQPPGSLLSSSAVMTYGRAIHALRRFTQASLNKEPSWRGRRP